MALAAGILIVAVIAALMIWRTNPAQTTTRFEDFTRSDSATDLGGAWKQLRGTWGIIQGQAYVSAPAPGAQLAVQAIGNGDVNLATGMATPVVGAGIAFWVADENDYWAVVAQPAFATWNVVRVVGGQSTVIGNTGLTLAGSGEVFVEVHLVGDELSVFVGGTRAASARTDEVLARQLAGLVQFGEINAARWIGFSVTRES